MQIKYYLSFEEENRISMDEYAKQLMVYQKKNYKNVYIQSFRPKIDVVSRLMVFNTFKMRYARFICYPKQIKNFPK